MTDNKWLRNSFVWVIIMVAMLVLFFTFVQRGAQPTEIPISQVVADAKAGAITEITVREENTNITVCYGPCKTGEQKTATREPGNTTMREYLTNAGVPEDKMPKINVEKASSWGQYIGILGFLLPTLILVAVFVFMMRQAQGTNNQAMSFGKSRARLFTGNKPTITFADVAGVDEAKQELTEVVEFLKYPDKFNALGARIPRGVLLVGPPGTGKTMLARACAGEAGVPFFSISGSEFVEMFVGVGASRVRDLFDQAKRNSPCIIFVDEIDAVGRHRGAGLGGSHDEREQTLNQILVEMDGFDSQTNIIVVAATNRPDVLDPALLRPGRFDRQVVLDRPDIKGRVAILGVHSRGKPLDKTVNLETIAKVTPGFSGADLENLVNESAILAARRNRKTVSMSEMEEAIDRVIAGPERRSRIISEREKAITAYHEVGHALVARMLPNVDPVHKISIISRGMMGGYTRVLPGEDRYMWSKSQFKDNLAFALGGRAAEEIIFQEITTGASNDIERVTEMARQMVTRYGMSKKLGPVALGRKEELVFLGREISEQRNYSDEIAYEIDKEVRVLVDEAYGKAAEILTMFKEKLIEISELLIEKETLDASDFEALFQDIPRPEPRLVNPPRREPVVPVTPPTPEQPRQPVPGLQGAPGMAFAQEPERDISPGR
ncbi:MAG TPA: ATP-dependent zinc metalloprotease FtsH [Chloroflexia bacterium]|nr:ATP-dependent zinc metalloprotease FtsH [Chloroflexia bacterium]